MSPKYIREFQELYKKYFGVHLTEEQSQEYAEELVSFVKLLLLPNRNILGKK